MVAVETVYVHRCRQSDADTSFVVHCSLRYKPLAGRIYGRFFDVPPSSSSSDSSLPVFLQTVGLCAPDGRKIDFLHRPVRIFFTLTTRRIAACVVRPASIDRLEWCSDRPYSCCCCCCCWWWWWWWRWMLQQHQLF